MANRTPGLQTRSQYHRNWGNYSDGGVTTPANGTLPNQPSNVLTNPEYSKLEAGDLAYVDTTDPGVYYCVSPGTLGGGDAIWSALAAGGSVIQTIRDAHQLVVAQDGAPWEISTVGSGNNAVNISCDFLDAGDGLQLQAALAAASALKAAGFLGVDVRVRPCDITLDPNTVGLTVPLSIPADVRLIGAGGVQGRASTLRGGNGTGGTTQRILSMGSFSALEDFQIISPNAAAVPAAEPDEGCVTPNLNSQIRSCFFVVLGGGVANRSFANAIGTGPIGNTSTSNAVIDQCRFSMPDSADTDGVQSYAISLGYAGSLLSDVQPCLITDCRVLGGNGAVRAVDRAGPIIDNVYHLQAQNTGNGSVFHANTASVTSYRGMQVNNFTLEVGASDVTGSQGIGIACAGSNNANIVNSQLENIRISFADAPAHVNDRRGVAIVAATPQSLVTSVQMTNVQIDADIIGLSGLDVGVYLDVSAAVDAAIEDVSITNLRVKNAGILSGPALGYGVWLRGGVDGVDGFIRNTGIHNSRIIDCEGIHLFVDGATALDTIAIGNHFKGVGTAISDTGTGTEAAHNIV